MKRKGIIFYIIILILIIFIIFLITSKTEEFKTLEPRYFPYGGVQAYNIQNMYYDGPEPSYVGPDCRYS